MLVSVLLVSVLLVSVVVVSVVVLVPVPRLRLESSRSGAEGLTTGGLDAAEMLDLLDGPTSWRRLDAAPTE
jgi:hypothetical protein